jgi:hypothetical protein
MTAGERYWAAWGRSAAGRVFLGGGADPSVCPNCGSVVDEADVALERPTVRKGLPDVPGQVEVAACRNEQCCAQLARLRAPEGDTGPWNAVVADAD